MAFKAPVGESLSRGCGAYRRSPTGLLRAFSTLFWSKGMAYMGTRTRVPDFCTYGGYLLLSIKE